MEKLMMGPQFKRNLIIATPFLVFILMTLVWILGVKPYALSVIKQQLPQINMIQNAALIEVGEVDLSILKLQAMAYDVRVSLTAKDSPLEPLTIKEVRAQIDFFDLLIGRLSVAKINVESLNGKILIRPTKDEKPLPEIPLEDIFKILPQVPVDHVIMNDSHFALTDGADLNINLKADRLSVSNFGNSAFLKISALEAAGSTGESTTLTAALGADIVMTPEKLIVKNSSVSLIDSQILLNAEMRDYRKILSSPQGRVELQGNVVLNNIKDIYLSLFPQKKRLPRLTGDLSFKSELSIKGFDDISGSVDVKTTQVNVDHFKLGQAEINTRINRNQILINKINLEHPAGLVQLSQIRFEQKSPYNFSASIDVNRFNLNELFQSINLKQVPAGLILSGRAQCNGKLLSELSANCKVTETDISDIWVRSAVPQKYIVKLKTAKLTGEANFTEEKMNYTANISVGKNSVGTSTGEVIFLQGFNIKFDAQNLDFADVEDLAGLNLKGKTKLTGQAYGDSHYGVIDAQISATEAEIDLFRLGQFSSSLSYKDAVLSFNNISGLIGRTDYKGQVTLNLADENLKGQIESQQFYGEDLLQVLNQKFSIAFPLYGKGRMNAQFEGPFNFWKLNMKADAQLNKGSVADERFEKLNIVLNSDGKRINFSEARLTKLKSQIFLTGDINTENAEPVFNLKLKASPLQLEESDHILEFAPSIAGTGFADGEIKGALTAPELSANITLKQVTYDKVEYPNSQGELTLNKDFMQFKGQFFGRQIQTDFKWPWEENKAFYAKVLVQDLNPLFLLPLISLPQPGGEFDSQLSAELDLSSRTRRLSEADGFVRISDFYVQRGNQSLKLTKPGRMAFKNGLTGMDDFILEGTDNNQIRVHLNQASNTRLRLNVESNLQLKLIQFLVPFAQNLSGQLSVNSQLIFKETGFELFGEGELIDGLVGLKALPQPIENINTPIEFSKSKIILSDITGKLGPSDVTGLGQIDILGPKNIAVNLRAIADNVQLVFPKQVYSEGKANIYFGGNWIPYDLKIDYKVSRGLVENNFEPDPQQSQTLKASSFLPPQQAEMLSPSLNLDINVDMTSGILVRNKLLEGEAKGVLQVQGTPEQPIMIGKIDIVSGSKLIFKDKPFEIQTAAIQFQGTKDINPDIYITANSRVSDYDINLLVQGLAKNLTITPTSQPPLSQNDIFTLLALGVTNQGNQNLSSETQQRQTGLEVLAAISNQSQLNKRIQERLGLTVQLAPSVDSTKNIAVPKVVVSKKLGKKINASYSKPFNGNDENQEVKLQYLYNNNVSLQFNYQNKDTNQQEQITNSTNTNRSIFGIDLELRDEFK